VKGVERLAHATMGQTLSAREVIFQARAGDPAAGVVIAQIGRWLGQLLASLCSIYLPDRVALSGGISEVGPLLLDAVRQRFDELVADYHKNTRALGMDFYQGVDFVLGEMRGQTGVVGSVVGFFQENNDE
jgi:predicted NBD/HSP70 family sugar kinase